MGKTKIVVTSRIPKKELDYIRSSLEEDYEFLIPKEYTEEEILALMDGVEIVLGNYVTEEMLKKGVSLIQNPFAGVENFDFSLLKKYPVKLLNSHSNSDAVAEHALGLMMAVARKIPYHDRLMREGNWNRGMEEETLFSTSLRNKTIGIIGYGGIGRSLGKLLLSFNPRLLAIVRDKNKSYEELDFIGDFSDLEYVVSQSDFLVVAVPLTESTRGMLDLELLSKMKEEGFLINISRGNVVDEKALYELLEKREIRGAAIDTWYQYPKDIRGENYPSKYDFHKLNNLVMSPHRAPMTYGEFTNVEDAIYNLREYLGDGNFINLVNIEEGY